MYESIKKMFFSRLFSFEFGYFLLHSKYSNQKLEVWHLRVKSNIQTNLKLILSREYFCFSSCIS